MTFEDLKARVESCGYSNLTGIEILEAKDGRAVGRIVLEKKHMNPIGSVHGGCIFTMVDTVSGTAFVTTGKSCTTLSSNIDYLSAAINSKVLTATAEPARIGRHIAVYDVKVTDDCDRLIAKASVTFYVLGDMDIFNKTEG